MNPLFKNTLYLFLLYPIYGYLMISFFGLPPYYSFSILILITYLVFLGSRKSKLVFPKYSYFLFYYLLLVTISLYIANDKPLLINNDLGQLVWIINPLLLIIMIENTRFSKKFIDVSKRIMLFLVIFAALISIIQYFQPTFFLYYEKYTGADDSLQGFQQRIGSIFTWGDLMNVQYMASGFAMMYAILLIEYKNNKTISILLPVLVGIVMFLSQFRIAMLTYLIVTSLLVLNKVSVKSITIVVLSVIAFYIIIFLIGFNLDYFIENRMKSETAFSRLDAFTAFIVAFPENPYFGTGGEKTKALFEGFGHIARMHNTHLNVAYYYGAFAFLAHSIFLIYLLRNTYRTGKHAKYWPPFIGVLVILATMMTEHTVLFYEPGFIFLLVFNKYYFEKHQENKQVQILSNVIGNIRKNETYQPQI